MILVDGNNVYYSGFSVKAFDWGNMRLGGAVVSILSVLKYSANGNLLVVWDGSNAVKRKREEFYDGYKLSREKMKEDMFFKMLNELKYIYKEGLGIHQAYSEEDEADDVIAHLVYSFLGNGKITIVSNDRDFYQLLFLSDDVVMVSRSKEIRREDVKEETGCSTKEEWLWYKALVGDGSDNISGKKGVGPVKAAEIIKRGISDVEKQEVKCWYDLMNLDGNLRGNLVLVEGKKNEKLVMDWCREYRLKRVWEALVKRQWFG
uniref:5'-3' exonuclease domain-containing protein n=1 Tax=candidate division CPR3 bacterium TaxID=2268181 RepID=A0A7V3J985_UNCC3